MGVDRKNWAKRGFKGKWEKPLPTEQLGVTDEDRRIAMERALLISQLLMDLSVFEKLVAWLHNLSGETDQGKRKQALKDVCDEVDLEQKQVDWLWMYLQHYESAQNWTGTGW